MEDLDSNEFSILYKCFIGSTEYFLFITSESVYYLVLLVVMLVG